MGAVDKIRAVLDTSLLMPELVIVPSSGATDNEISDEQALVGRIFCNDHVAILRQWNGIALDIVKLFGCSDSVGEIGRISAWHRPGEYGVVGAVVVGADPSGFL